jgi:hypothetical protein
MRTFVDPMIQNDREDGVTLFAEPDRKFLRQLRIK